MFSDLRVFFNFIKNTICIKPNQLTQNLIFFFVHLKIIPYTLILAYLIFLKINYDTFTFKEVLYAYLYSNYIIFENFLYFKVYLCASDYSFFESMYSVKSSPITNFRLVIAEMFVNFFEYFYVKIQNTSTQVTHLLLENYSLFFEFRYFLFF